MDASDTILVKYNETNDTFTVWTDGLSSAMVLRREGLDEQAVLEMFEQWVAADDCSCPPVDPRSMTRYTCGSCGRDR